MSDMFNDPSAGIALVVAVISLIGTIIMAFVSLKNTQVQASDEIASGSMTLLEEYRKERVANKKAIEELKVEVKSLQQWQSDVTAFIVPFIEGSKANERQLIEAKMTPVYKLPPLPEWLHS